MANKNISVIIIDDEKDILDMIEKYLKREGNYSVRTYQNPITALSAIDNNVDIVLLDIMMP
jgi:DNA-binding response OmpR family regulator